MGRLDRGLQKLPAQENGHDGSGLDGFVLFALREMDFGSRFTRRFPLFTRLLKMGDGAR